MDESIYEAEQDMTGRLPVRWDKIDLPVPLTFRQNQEPLGIGTGTWDRHVTCIIRCFGVCQQTEQAMSWQQGRYCCICLRWPK